jgi:peptide/nickel transport system substrate-binding protein
MTITRRSALAGTAAALAAPAFRSAAAQSRRETLLMVKREPANSTDIQRVGATARPIEASWNLYDRLLTFGVKKDATE